MLSRHYSAIALATIMALSLALCGQTTRPGDDAPIGPGPAPGPGLTPPFGPRFGPGRGGRPFDEVKTQIRASDEEWQVIGPKLRKLVTARQLIEGGAGLAFGPGLGPGPGGFRGQPGGPGRAFGGPGGGGPGPGGPGGPGGFGRRTSFDGPGGFGPDGGPRGGGPPGGGFPGPGNFVPDGNPRRGADGPAPAPGARGGEPTPGTPGTSAFPRPGDFGPGGGPGGGLPGPGGFGPGGRGGGPGGPGGPDMSALRTEFAPLFQAQADLQTVLEDRNAAPESLREKIAALRLARQKARDQLAAIQKDLIELLTDDQQAVLISLGYLD